MNIVEQTSFYVPLYPEAASALTIEGTKADFFIFFSNARLKPD
jgi:hypothetical protein